MRFCDYPDNLLREIMPEDEIPKEKPEDFDASLAYVFAGLTPKQQKCVEYRFRRALTLEQAGREFGVTRERVRQLEKKTILRLKQPEFVKYLKYGVSGVIAREVESERRTQYEKAVQHMSEEIRNLNTEEIAADMAAKCTSLFDLNLSIRSYNCLSRRGIENAYGILNLSKYEFWNIRNLGKKSGTEIITKLEEKGFNCENLKIAV